MSIMGYFVYLLGEISSEPLDVIREEFSVLEPWKVVLSITLVLVIGAVIHKSNQ